LKGAELCTELKRALGVATNAELAKLIGVTSSRVAQIGSKRIVSARNVAKIVEQASRLHTKDAFAQAIHPIVEFFEITSSQSRENGRFIPFSKTTSDGRKLYSRLVNASGLYSYYNSQAEIIYLGKTETNNHYAELINAFNRKLTSYEIYCVEHPSGRFKPRSEDKLRRIKKIPVRLCDTAAYFSAYSVSSDFVGVLEALFIRIAPNELINVRIERSTLTAFAEPDV
jgi:DNA-binding transcriptional regulator YdaS (Cro superfamily)